MLFILSTVLGCSKSEKDFVGVYRTYYSTPIEIVDIYDRVAWFNKNIRPRDNRSSGIIFNDLGEIKIELFWDKQRNVLTGEAVFYLKEADNESSRPSERTQKIDLDVSNLRLKGDTLEFSVDNQIMRNRGQRVIGKIITSQNVNVVGLGKESVLNSVTNLSPFYLSQNSDMVFFNCYDDKESKQLIHSFFVKQEEGLIKEIELEKNIKNKHTAENSLREVRTHK